MNNSYSENEITPFEELTENDGVEKLSGISESNHRAGKSTARSSAKGFLKRAAAAGLAGAMVLGAVGGCGSSQKTDVSSNDSHDFNLFGNSDKEDDNAGAGAGTTGEFDAESSDVIKKTQEIEKYIDGYFYFDEDDTKREESYYDGLMKGLDDPYSVYYTKEEYEKMMEDDSGEFEGIGATVSKNRDNGTVYVVKPIAGSPAEKAGLLPNDIIVSVDDLEVTSDMELDYVVDHIRGEKGTEVVLKIYREGESDYIDIPIIRDTIENKTVEYEMLDDNIGYISVEQFIENTPELFEEALDDLQSQGAEGVVIDMRNNPGGLLRAVIEMVDYIVDDKEVAEGSGEPGLLLQTKDKDDNILEEYKCSDGHSVDIPMTILVNGNSASASEIFTGCLKDYGKATVVGTTTYGKGIVQSVIKLSDGSAIKITIAQYFLPSGTAVHKVGVEPDKEVELDDDLKQKVTIEHDEDNQLQEAIKTFD